MDSKVDEIFAERLRCLREEKGLSQVELSEQVGISRGSIGFWETHKRTASIEALKKLADFFGCSADYLLGISNAKSIETYIKDIVTLTGLSEKAVVALCSKQIFERDNARDIFSRLIEYEVPPSFIATINNEDGEIENFYNDPSNQNTPLLSLIIACIINNEKGTSGSNFYNAFFDKGVMEYLHFSRLQDMIKEVRQNLLKEKNRT